MQKKLLLSYFIIILLAIGISATTFWKTGYNFIEEENNKQYLKQAELIADTFLLTEFHSQEDFSDFANYYSEKFNIRITIIDLEGEVIVDSQVQEELENHKDRTEVLKAIEGEISSIIRFSKTLGTDYFYNAFPIKQATFTGVLRVSIPLAEIKTFNSAIKDSIIRAIIVCFIVAILVAFFFTEILNKPIDEITEAAEHISNGDYDIKIYTRDKSQIARLASSFNIMATNLKETIRNLTQRKTELEAILGSMAGGVIALNDENEILFFNKSFIRILNLEKKDVKGDSIYNVIRNITIYNVIDQVRQRNQKVKLEGKGPEKNQTISITGTPLVDGGNELFGVLIIIEDISQIKKLETIRTDFVSNVTHELKTPLTSIRGFIDTLKNGNVKDKAVANKFLDIIDIEAERLSRLIQDILLLSEIESKVDREAVSCNIIKIANDVIELLEPELGDNVTIVFEAPPYIRPFLCNSDRMKELFINLIDNAIKYTEKGKIQVECKEEDENLIIIVKDSGIGIEKKYLPRIFERFYRVDKGRSRKLGGTGLGLSIVKHIVQLYDGNIMVNSNVGEGTEIIIVLPYIRKD